MLENSYNSIEPSASFSGSRSLGYGKQPRRGRSGAWRVDTDHVWEGHAFKVNDEAAFLAALEKFIASETGKKFPGQVYLSQVVAGGLMPVTHTISVGFASEAEMDAWNTLRSPTADWATYLGETRKSSEYLGTNLVRDLKSWGPATFTGLSTP